MVLKVMPKTKNEGGPENGFCHECCILLTALLTLRRAIHRARRYRHRLITKPSVEHIPPTARATTTSDGSDYVPRLAVPAELKRS